MADTTAHSGPTVPSPAALRVALRRVRRTHSDRTLGELLTDVYLFAFLAVLYGGGAAVSVRRHLAQPLTAPPADAALRAWLDVALLLTAGALAWRGLRALGPLVATPAVQSFVLATPIDRGGWLRPPLTVLLVLTGVGGGAAGVLAGWAGLSGSPAWAALVGAGIGVALAAAAVATQGAPARAWRWTSAGALGAGLALVAAVVVGRRTHASVPGPAAPAIAAAVLAVVVAVLAVRLAVRALPHLDRAALGGGAQLAGAAMTAAVMLDPSLLSGVLVARRWRAAAEVHSRHLYPGGRLWVLLQADLIRQLRRGADLLAYAALALAPYAVGVFSSLATGPVRVIAAYLATDRLAGGLRAVARTPALRRILGGSDRELRLIHLVVPGTGLVVWWAATAAADTPRAPVVTAILVVGVLAAVYRTATRPPMSYDANLADSPLGPIPTTVLRRLVRGPDLVAILVLIDLFTSLRPR